MTVISKKAIIEERLKEAYQLYYDWWHPIDIAAGSVMGAMPLYRFYETLLTYPDTWWDRWLSNSTDIRYKSDMKTHILKMVIKYHTGFIGLNNK